MDGLISGKGLKGALNEAAQGFGTGAFSGAISGGIAGGLGAGVGAQRAIRTLGDTLGDLGGRALDGEKITAGDVVLALGINAAFNAAGPKVLDKVKNSKFGQAVSGKISNVKDVIKGKVGGAFSAVKEKVSGKLASTGAEAVNANSAVSGVGRKTDFYAGSKGITTSLEEYDQFVAGNGQIASSKNKASLKPKVSYERPSGFRKGVRDKVWENAKNSNGDVIDPVTNRVMNKSEPWDMGHKPGYEFRKHKQSAENRGISRKEFLDEYNNPEHYRPELPSSNRSHKGEDLTDKYFGD